MENGEWRNERGVPMRLHPDAPDTFYIPRSAVGPRAPLA